jgi:hypothetical protein
MQVSRRRERPSPLQESFGSLGVEDVRQGKYSKSHCALSAISLRATDQIWLSYPCLWDALDGDRAAEVKH